MNNISSHDFNTEVVFIYHLMYCFFSKSIGHRGNYRVYKNIINWHTLFDNVSYTKLLILLVTYFIYSVSIYNQTTYLKLLYDYVSIKR